jgi:hypothetical protein
MPIYVIDALGHIPGIAGMMKIKIKLNFTN